VNLPVVRKTTSNQQGVLNVRTSLRFATIVASLLSVLLGARLGLAQATYQAPPRAAAPSTAVIDIGFIFKNHHGFKGMMEDMKADLEATEQMFRKKTEDITKMAEGLTQFHPGTPQYNQLEEKITHERAQLQAEMALKKKEFMLREANIYYTVYNQVIDEVSDFCQRHGVNLVLRFNSEKIEPQSPESVMKGVNRNVVYQVNSNITNQILEQINRHIPNNAGGVSNLQTPLRRN
jgi:Skp family chaperone for outer membrane proteins